MSIDRAEDQVIEVVQSGDRRQGLIQHYRQRQEVQQRTVAVPGRPQEEAGDITSWGGLRRRKSAELRQHEAQMQANYRAAQWANYAREWGLALEVHGVQTSIRAIEMEEGSSCGPIPRASPPRSASSWCSTWLRGFET